VSLPRLRKHVAFERLLARLLVVAPGRWILKGGLALDFRLGDRARTTVDMDLACQDGEASADADLNAAQRTDLGDHLTFEIARTGILDDADVAGATRYRARASLAGRRFEDFVVDVGFADPSVAKPDEVVGPDLLAFADMPRVRIPTLPLPEHVAEKVHAYTRRYGPHQRPSTRVKDIVDLVLLSSTSTFTAGELRTALRRTFETRETHVLPRSFPTPPAEWEAPYRRLARDLSISPDLREAYRLSQGFLDSVLGDDIGDEARWDPDSQSWTPRAGR
jgi:hypothetical protein